MRGPPEEHRGKLVGSGVGHAVAVQPERGEAGVAREPAREQRGRVRAEAVVREREPLDAWSGLGFG